ncbi:hypothetical protein [Terriglobus roseus]|uniref:hypothetical protein n=1 Tax=Terriglobus roseus TaxID=392734 RepID=UPI00031008DF|nr:hypothetical protein [Terriglobus roseus]
MGYGAATASQLLAEAEEYALVLRFDQFFAGINVLKHGKGSSYERLLAQKDKLPFLLKAPDQRFFHEGDVSEPDTLVEVDDAFVAACAELVIACFIVVERLRPDADFG